MRYRISLHCNNNLLYNTMTPKFHYNLLLKSTVYITFLINKDIYHYYQRRKKLTLALQICHFRQMMVTHLFFFFGLSISILSK